jgi:hypothetical protein
VPGRGYSWSELVVQVAFLASMVASLAPLPSPAKKQQQVYNFLWLFLLYVYSVETHKMNVLRQLFSVFFYLNSFFSMEGSGQK